MPKRVTVYLPNGEPIERYSVDAMEMIRAGRAFRSPDKAQAAQPDSGVSGGAADPAPASSEAGADPAPTEARAGESLTNDQLIAAITEATGQLPHPNCNRDTLLKKYAETQK